jgi:hypothetical protein
MVAQTHAKGATKCLQKPGHAQHCQHCRRRQHQLPLQKPCHCHSPPHHSLLLLLLLLLPPPLLLLLLLLPPLPLPLPRYLPLLSPSPPVGW